MSNFEVCKEIETALLENKKVTVQEKGNSYDTWELVKTPRTIRWKNFYAGKKGTMKDLSKFFEYTTNLVIIRVE